MTMRPRTVAGMLDATVHRFGPRVAIVDGERRRTWAELSGDVHRRAGALHARGVQHGDAVAMVLGNDSEFVTTFLAVQVLGALAVPLNPQFTEHELGEHLDGCNVVATVTAEDVPALEDVPFEPLASPEPDDAALFAFSSGSTGRPKGMIRSNANLTGEAEQFSATVGVDEHDVILAVVALFHAHGLGNCLLAAIRAGATLVLVPRFERDAVLSAIEREGVTVFPGVPFIFHTLAETTRADREAMSSLRLCFSAGAPLSEETFKLFDARFARPVRQLYGCSEAGSVTINLDPDAEGTAASCGRPMHGVELSLSDDGEISFRSAALTSGYVGDPAASEAFHEGWFRTGDLGRLDASGNLYVTGRTKLFISTSGYKVDPYEVEEVLRAERGVSDVVVVGVEADRGEEIVKAVIVADGSLPEDELRAALLTACRARLAPFKVPRVFELRDEIPRSPLGKILRKHLV